jgi:hypothetical protein
MQHQMRCGRKIKNESTELQKKQSWTIFKMPSQYLHEQIKNQTKKRQRQKNLDLTKVPSSGDSEVS